MPSACLLDFEQCLSVLVNSILNLFNSSRRARTSFHYRSVPFYEFFSIMIQPGKIFHNKFHCPTFALQYLDSKVPATYRCHS